MPGWVSLLCPTHLSINQRNFHQGAWGGQGTRKTLPKLHLIKEIAGINPQSRADFGKAHVIISEKRDKKAAKYLTKDLPYPYTSKAQFERTLETPIGREWNTRIASQRATLPKVTKKVRHQFQKSLHRGLRINVSSDGGNHQTARKTILVPTLFIP